eukprot:33810_1
MSVETWLALTIYGAVGLVVVGFSAWFVSYYRLRGEPAGITGIVGFFSLLFGLLSLFLIPIDVYMCPKYGDGHDYRGVAKFIYYCFYTIFLFCLFIAIPFGYFYYEELGDLEDRRVTFIQKACSALKYTGFTALLWITLIVIGLFVNFNSGTPNSGNDEWTHKIADSFGNNLGGIMPFCIAVVTAIGMFFSMVYTAYGLAAFPISLMRPIIAPDNDDPKHLQVELKRVSCDLDMLYTKYRGHDSWSPKDKATKNALERKKKALTIKTKRASSNISLNSGKYIRETCCERLTRCFWNCAAPIRYIIGISLEGFSILLITSIMMHIIDQGVNSSCGYACGFALNDPKIAQYDPISWILTNCSDYFPLDYVFFTGIIFWIFWCTIFGVMRIDVRCLCFKLFSLRAHETMHNALLMAIGFLLLVLTSFNYLMYSFASQYMTFGDQGHNCAIVCDASDTDCKVCQGTEIYYLLSGIMIGMPIFGLVYFVFSGGFVLCYFFSLVYNLYRKPKKHGRLLRRGSDDGLEAVFRD